MKKTIIIGAGAAGLMSAITAATEGNEVIILEHKDCIGKKLSVTGNGKCNFTNLSVEDRCYNSSNKGFYDYVLKSFNSEKTIEYFENMGMSFVNKNNYIYPRSETAASVVEFFKEKCRSLNVSIKLNAEVKKIIKTDDGFAVEYICEGKRLQLKCDNVIVAAGSKAAKKTGSDGSGYYFAKCLGHNIIEPVPGLVALNVKEEYIKKLAGVRATGKVSVLKENDNIKLSEDTGEIQFTSYGVSGIPVFQVSRFAARELQCKNNVYGIIDLFTEMEEKNLTEYLKDKCINNPESTIKMMFLTLFNKKITEMIFEQSDIAENSLCSKVTEEKIIKIANFIKNIKFTITDTGGFDNAQVCAGGVDTKEINHRTMESTIVPGVYFVGEVLDVDGICGGYNLQWAWSSGYVAGKSVADKIV